MARSLGLTERELAAGGTLVRTCKDPKQAKVIPSLTADKGYFAVEGICCLQKEKRPVIGDPHASKRRKDKQDGTRPQPAKGATRTCAHGR